MREAPPLYIEDQSYYELDENNNVSNKSQFLD